MDALELTVEEFTLLMHRAGLALSPADMTALFDEIAPSCAIVGAMAAHIRTRVAPQHEPANTFRRAPDYDAG